MNNLIIILLIVVIFVSGMFLVCLHANWLVGVGVFLMLWGNDLGIKAQQKK